MKFQCEKVACDLLLIALDFCKFLDFERKDVPPMYISTCYQFALIVISGSVFNPKWVLGFGMLDEVANFVLSFSKFSWL